MVSRAGCQEQLLGGRESGHLRDATAYLRYHLPRATLLIEAERTIPAADMAAADRALSLGDPRLAVASDLIPPRTKRLDETRGLDRGPLG